MTADCAKHLEAFADVLKPNEPLAPYTHLRLGGPAEILALPRTQEELANLVKVCHTHQIPVRILGSGSNVLVRDEGVKGVVIRLSQPAFTQVTVDHKRVHAGSGTSLSAVISTAARHGLAGLETHIGIPGTVGESVRSQASDPSESITPFVRRVEVIDSEGNLHVREREGTQFGDPATNLEDGIVVNVVLELEPDLPDTIVKRMRKAWIKRKSTQPYSYQATCQAFKNPRGMNAATLIEQAQLAGAKVGGAQLSERDSNYIVAHAGATARDVMRLLDLVRTQVQERFQIELEPELTAW
ncbi:MAG: UDP-N-acetylmuramate dehydrogenase [Gemmataceae bacterium]